MHHASLISFLHIFFIGCESYKGFSAVQDGFDRCFSQESCFGIGFHRFSHKTEKGFSTGPTAASIPLSLLRETLCRHYRYSFLFLREIMATANHRVLKKVVRQLNA